MTGPARVVWVAAQRAESLDAGRGGDVIEGALDVDRVVNDD
jgi:hypothetical protein